MSRDGRPLKFKDPKELEERIEEYFKTTGWVLREVYDKRKQEVVSIQVFEPATITGLACFLDTSRQTLNNYELRDDFFDLIKKARDRCEHAIEYGALTGQLNPAMAIFTAKNNYDWKDKNETDITSGGDKIQTVQFEILKNEPKDEDNSDTGEEPAVGEESDPECREQ